jgi:uncharacterized protein (TIGR00645 family)
MKLERLIESCLFASRWLLAPIYLGLSIGLLLLLATFAMEMFDLVQHFSEGDRLITGLLALLDFSLMANLVLMVMLAGYENFVSRLDLHSHTDRPEWMGHIGFGEIKMKLITSIVAISAVHLLENFMNVDEIPDRVLAWRAGLRGLFIVSGVMFAFMDRLGGGGTEGH